MKTTIILKSMVLSAATLVLPTLFTACSSDEELAETPSLVEKNEEHTMTMRLNGGAPSFGNVDTRATEAAEIQSAWEDGATILLRFCDTNGTPSVMGKAKYQASTDSWVLSYYGSLTSGKELKCHAFYFDGVSITDNNKVEPSPFTPVYSTESGSYFVDNGEIVVNATLMPMTARVMFKGGKENGLIWAGNLLVCKSFTLDEGFVLDEDTFVVTLNASGNSEYIYGFTSEECNNIIALANDGYEYKKQFDADRFTAGSSGYVEIPSQEVNKGWMCSNATWGIPAENLGLSVYWAKMNVGAINESDQGIVCSWGDAYGTNTSTSSNYNQDIYTISGIAEYDIATRTIGGRWHIPTKEEWNELFDNCTLTKETVNGIAGIRATASNGNSIFLPAYDRTSGSSNTVNAYDYAYYWSSTTYNSSFGYYTSINIKATNPSNSWQNNYKYNKMCIRPVYE